jgi:hypothetical protein
MDNYEDGYCYVDGEENDEEGENFWDGEVSQKNFHEAKSCNRPSRRQLLTGAIA